MDSTEARYREMERERERERASDGSSTNHIQVVLMVMTAPLSQERRDLHRRSLSELTQGVTVNDTLVKFIVRYAVGDAYPCYNETEQLRTKNLLNAEAHREGDIAFLNISDACKPGKSVPSSLPPYWWELSYCDTGKSWHLFQWAHRNYPKAKLIFRQDDDALVDWRVLLPGMIAHARMSVNYEDSFNLQRLFLGMTHRTVLALENRTCVEGQAYGFSSDVVSWIGQQTSPRVAIEDLEACNWADYFDEAHPEDPINRNGIMPMETVYNDWHAALHPVKDNELFKKCYEDRVHGCTLLHAGHILPCSIENGSIDCPRAESIHFKLPSNVSSV